MRASLVIAGMSPANPLVSRLGRGGALSLIALVALVALAAACAAPYGERVDDSSAITRAPSETTGATDATERPPTMPAPIATSGGGGSAGGGGTAGGGSPHPDGGVAGDAGPLDPAHCPAKSASALTSWNAPPAASAACSAADITYFGQAGATQTWLGIESLMTKRNAACSACIFSHDTDASWHAVIYSGAEGNAILNYAACFASAPGGSVACGRAVFAWSDCYARVCDSAACGSDAAVTTCYDSQGASDACAAYSPITACGGTDSYAAINNVCSSYIDTARALCASGANGN